MTRLQRPGVRQRGFTLLELLCALAILGLLASLLLPAIQGAREKVRRNRCADKMRMLAFGHLQHESAKGGLLELAKFWWNTAEPGQTAGYHDPGAYPDFAERPGNWYDDHGWYFPLMPYIEQASVLALGDPDQPASASANQAMRKAEVALHACPSDLGLQRNEFNSGPNPLRWARLRGNYVVNAGNTVYGQHDLFAPCPGGDGSICHYGGAPFNPIELTPLKRIADGLSNTLMMSEVLVLPEQEIGWGGPYSENQVAIAGQTFTGWNTPNSQTPDYLALPGQWYQISRDGFLQQGIPLPIEATTRNACGTLLRGATFVGGQRSAVPLQDSNGVKQQCITARSHHRNGVNAARCDGSVRFYRDAIDPQVWNSLTSAWAGD